MKKTIFMKEIDMLELNCSSGERVATMSEGVIPPPPQPCGGLKESNKPMNENKNKKKTRGLMSNKKFLVCHYYKKRGNNATSCWYAKACTYCGKKGHHEVSCWKKQAMFHRPNCFKKNKYKKTPPTQQQTQRQLERKSMSSSPYYGAKTPNIPTLFPKA
jgi:hypothetical protein